MSDINSLSSSKQLLKRLDGDIRNVHAQLDILEIVFKNLQGSWFAVLQAHKVFKTENEEEI